MREFLDEINWDIPSFDNPSSEDYIHEVLYHDELNPDVEYLINREWEELSDERFHTFIEWRLESINYELKFYKEYGHAG